jgi:hypothetical protein
MSFVRSASPERALATSPEPRQEWLEGYLPRPRNPRTGTPLDAAHTRRLPLLHRLTSLHALLTATRNPPAAHSARLPARPRRAAFPVPTTQPCLCVPPTNKPAAAAQRSTHGAPCPSGEPARFWAPHRGTARIWQTSAAIHPSPAPAGLRRRRSAACGGYGCQLRAGQHAPRILQSHVCVGPWMGQTPAQHGRRGMLIMGSHRVMYIYMGIYCRTRLSSGRCV